MWSAIAEGDRIQSEREIFRQRSAAIVQGFRTRDAAFRLFRNEKLERYKTLFDLAAEYAFLAAKAYDYETGLLHTEEGHGFINRAISARALGVVNEGQPQFAGSNTGDPGLSSVLAEMKGDWDVLKGRLATAALLEIKGKAKVNGELNSHIADLAHQEQWRIIELYTQKGKLDEVFRNITLPDTSKGGKQS